MTTTLRRPASEDIETLHRASMEILQDTGMAFHHPEALGILQDHDVRVVGQTAFFEPDQILQWIRKAPAVSAGL